MDQPKPNFEQMTRKQLREYILVNREDEDAIHALAVRLRSYGKTSTVDEFIEYIKQKSLEA